MILFWLIFEDALVYKRSLRMTIEFFDELFPRVKANAMKVT